MGQTLSVQETYIPPLILIFPQELIGIFELTLAKICKAPYNRYEQHYEMRTAAVLCDSHYKFSEYKDSIKAHKLYNGWLCLK
jgi:hypothetical protein